MSYISRLPIVAIILSAAFLLEKAEAQVPVKSLDSEYAESFEGLITEGEKNWEDNTTVKGWLANRTSISAIGAGAAVTPVPGLYSLGSKRAGGALDRSLGGVASVKEPVLIALRLINETGKEITSCDLSFVIKQFRSGDPSNQISVATQVYPAGTGNLLDEAVWTACEPAEFRNEISGNESLSPVFFHERSATLSNLAWKPGEELCIRWKLAKQRGNGVPLGLDDIVVRNFSDR